jgi:hypothetical protein
MASQVELIGLNIGVSPQDSAQQHPQLRRHPFSVAQLGQEACFGAAWVDLEGGVERGACGEDGQVLVQQKEWGDGPRDDPHSEGVGDGGEGGVGGHDRPFGRPWAREAKADEPSAGMCVSECLISSLARADHAIESL